MTTPFNRCVTSTLHKKSFLVQHVSHFICRGVACVPCTNFCLFFLHHGLEWELSLHKVAAVNIITASKTYSLHVQKFSVSFTVAFQSIRTLHPIILFSLLEAVSNHMLWYCTNNVRFVHMWLKKWAIIFWLFTPCLSRKYEMIKKDP